MGCIHFPDFPESKTFRVIYLQKRLEPIGPDPPRRDLKEGRKDTERNRHRKDQRDTKIDRKQGTEGRHNTER
jgi:hypothetical protein